MPMLGVLSDYFPTGAMTSWEVVLNTSFNIKGEPVVSSPDDALRCFFGTGMDMLIMGSYVIDKEKGCPSDR